MDLEALNTHLSRLDHSAALALVDRARSDGASVEAIVNGLLAPALVEVGRRWAGGEVGAAEGLAAAAIARQALPRTPAPPVDLPGHQSVAVCCPPGEHHEIPAEMVTELLRAEGCPAQHIGAGISPRHLPGYLSRQRPAALLISVTTPCGLPGAARTIEVAHSYGVPAIVGGAAFGKDALLAVRLGAAAWAPTARHVGGIVESWLSGPAPLPMARPLTDEYLMFEAGLPEIRSAAVRTLRRVGGDNGGDGSRGLVDTQDRLDLLLRHLGASLLVDDGRLFFDFLTWRTEYYAHRSASSERLIDSLSSVGNVLPAEFTRARRFVAEGRQHVAWLSRSGAATASDAETEHGRIATSATAGTVQNLGNVRPLRTEATGTAAGVPARPVSAQEQRGRVFADLLFVAATTCHAPYALISVAQGEGRWSTLGHGVERRDLLSDDRIFAAIGRSTESLEISDLAAHPVLGQGPLARGPLGVRFLYGIPLRARQSSLLGVLCVLDRRPRELSTRERQALTAVARQIAGQLVMFRRSAQATPAAGPTIAPAPQPASVSLASALARVGSAASRPSPTGQAPTPSLEGAGALDRSLVRLERDGHEELLRSHEVAVLFDVTDRTVINWAAAGKLPSIRTAGGHLRFRGDDVLALLAGRPIESRSALA